MTMWEGDFIDIQQIGLGSFLTSKKCYMTMPYSPDFIFTRIKPQGRVFIDQ